MRKLEEGEQTRHFAATAMNHHSSRSHTIFRLYVQGIKNKVFDRNKKRQGVINVDINKKIISGTLFPINPRTNRGSSQRRHLHRGHELGGELRGPGRDGKGLLLGGPANEGGPGHQQESFLPDAGHLAEGRGEKVSFAN